MTVKNNQRRLYQQIVSQFRGNRHFPVVISDFEASHGRQVRWTLRARIATGGIRERWAGASWIIELVSTGRRDGKPFHHMHLYGLRPTASTSPPCAPARKRCCALCVSAGHSASQKPIGYENQWHWPRDTQLGEDAHRYTHRNGVQDLALLRTMAFNLLRWNGFRSIRAGLIAVAHDISGMLSWFGIRAAETG